MIATFQIVGKLKSIDLKYSGNGKPFAEMKVYVIRRWEGGAEESVLPVMIFGKEAETASLITVDSLVMMNGRISEKRGEYEGRAYSRVQLVAQNVTEVVQ